MEMDSKIDKSLNISWKEGIPASIMLAFLDYYLVPYALFLGASTRGIALLVALPQLLASVAQLVAVRVVRLAGSRLRFIVTAAGFQAVLLVPVALLALASFPDQVLVLTALVIGFRVLNNLVGSAWGSLMSEYLPIGSRGRYFGWRSQIVGLAGLGGVALGGVLLSLMKGISLAWGFCGLFLGASVLRAISTALLAKMQDLSLPLTPDSDFTFLMFLRRFKESNFVRFVLYVSSILFGTFLAAPYFSVYMLRDLRLSYFNYMLIHLAGVLGALVAFPVWGKHADVVGNAKILKMTSLLVPAVPVLWLVSRQPMVLVVVEMFSGFVWGGFNLCATNFIYDAVSPQKRVRCLGYFNLINGTAIFLGSLLGGFLADWLPPVRWGYSLLTLFLISGILRLGAHFWLSPQFREVRESARPVSSRQLFFSVVGIRPVVGLGE